LALRSNAPSALAKETSLNTAAALPAAVFALLVVNLGGRIMLDQPGHGSHADLWVGLVTLLPWVLMVLRSFIAELAKSAAQAVWKTMARRRRAQQQNSTVTIVFVVSNGGDRDKGI
jgi:hypothetical protein